MTLILIMIQLQEWWEVIIRTLWLKKKNLMRGIIFNNHEINEASRDRATNGKELKEEIKRKKRRISITAYKFGKYIQEKAV